MFFKNSNGEKFWFDSMEDYLVNRPSNDLVELTEDEVSAHLAPQAQNHEDVKIARLFAYADPITGSDRYKAEAYAERLAGNESAAVEADEKMLKRREDIRSENPWPEYK